jgi:NAD(P)-dependent dehydrogenase (short-subunit alcohol dehydrogenase family)
MTRQRVLITGGASGIGLATTGLFVSRGANVAASYRKDAQRDAAREELAGRNVLWLRADLRSESDVASMMEAVVREFGGIDVLVNCASRTGKSAIAPFLDCSPELMDDIVDSNLKGTIRVSQAVARWMVSSGRGGAIVHVASVAALAAQEHASIYCATKAAQVALGKSMALELAPFGIRVNCVSPGDIQTLASETIVQDVREGGGSGKYIRVTPMGRRGRAEEVAAAIAWLSSPEASFITGANLVVDGGFLAY